MILDSLKNSALYHALNPRLERAFAWIAATDLERLEAGRHDIEGDDIFVNVMEVSLKRPADAKLEIHNAYLDIQVLVRGTEERFGWSERADLRRSLAPFDVQKDIELFDDAPQTYYTLRPGQFTILLPDDAHAPMVGEGTVKKIIVKVRM